MGETLQNELENNTIVLTLTGRELRSISLWFTPNINDNDLIEWCYQYFKMTVDCLNHDEHDYAIKFPKFLVDSLICSVGNVAYKNDCKILIRQRAKTALNKIEHQTKIWETKLIDIK